MLTTLLITGAILGLAFGLAEAVWWRKRIALRDRRQLPHGWLLTARIALALVVGIYIVPWVQMEWLLAGTPERSTLYIIVRSAGFTMLALTAVHRITFSMATGRPWYYMGDEQHKPDDSVYDTIMWTLAALFFVHLLKRWHPSFAWVMATVIEVSTFILLRQW